MDQPIFENAVPILSNILGPNAVAGMLAVFNLAFNTIASASEAVLNNVNAPHSSHSDSNYQAKQTYFSSTSSNGDSSSSTFQSQLFTYLSTCLTSLNAAFATLTDSDTPLTTYIAIALLSYLAFRIVYGFVSWIVRSVINLIKVSILITALTSLLWFIFTVTTVGDDDNDLINNTGGRRAGQQQPFAGNSNNNNHGSKNPILTLVGKFKAEYQRQQQHVQNAHHF
ncbi:hypothetical protein BG004_000567 [Podila humilis]|nr:hypothetical protein BG004_000567 [Podila humilis]